MCYWEFKVLGKVITQNNVQHMIHTDLINPDMKVQIEKLDEYLEKRLDDTSFFDDVRAGFYIDDVDEANEAEHGDGSNTPSDEAYGDMMTK